MGRKTRTVDENNKTYFRFFNLFRGGNFSNDDQNRQRELTTENVARYDYLLRKKITLIKKISPILILFQVGAIDILKRLSGFNNIP